MTAEQRNWYDTPLYYDIIFDADTAREVDFLEEAFARYAKVTAAGRGKRRVLEPACGSGRLVHEMARRDWSVSGFDGSDAMLDFARKRCADLKKKPKLWKDQMEAFVLPAKGRFDLAHCLVSTFKYLLTEAAAQECVKRVAESLKPGGLFVVGVHLSDYDSVSYDHERWEETRGDVHVVSNTRVWAPDRRKRLEPVRNRLRVAEGGTSRTQETRWDFRTYDASQLKRTLRLAAPELDVVACFDFTYDFETPRDFDDSYSDVLLILRKESE